MMHIVGACHSSHMGTVSCPSKRDKGKWSSSPNNLHMARLIIFDIHQRCQGVPFKSASVSF